MKKKIAVVGSRGYVGKNLSHYLADSFEIAKFSHSSSDAYGNAGLEINAHYSLDSLLGYVHTFDLIVFLLESKRPEDRILIIEFLSKILKDDVNTRVIVFSTFSIYSTVKSEYVKFKLAIEKLCNDYPNAYIFRPGVIYGGIPGGLYKSLLKFKQYSLLIIPGGDAITGYVNIEYLSTKVKEFIDLTNPKKTYPIVDVYLSLDDAVYLFGFRGITLTIPSKLCLFFIKPFICLINYLPLAIQSLITLLAIKKPDLPYLKFTEKKIFRRLLITQYFKYNYNQKNIFSISKFIRAIETTNAINQYFDLSEKKRFLFMKRLAEINHLSLIK